MKSSLILPQKSITEENVVAASALNDLNTLAYFQELATKDIESVTDVTSN